MGLMCRGILKFALAKNNPVVFQTLFKVNQSASHKYAFSTTSSAAARVFTDKHEWVDLNGKIGTVGISHYAQDSLGDIVYAQLPDVGSEFNLMDECGALESVKAASELYCPVSGKIVEKNAEVENTPALINSSCYEKGWLFKIELSKPEEMDQLMDEAAYEKFLKSQSEESG